ncbi:TetR/AcrR family transcriptional regulator [Marinactinospora rubrisoli]|uniref:TetR/AcrR family transcriptional regulator n=1 Tax=Marinactinospora rubrisoli TaxID=2715399 RepID=A0ABW2KG67_9ACTN
MTTTGRSVRAERRAETRERILVAAERLFAEQGISTVSNRQVSEAAGQGNNFAVGYHFGDKTGLVRAIMRRHAEPTERLRERYLAENGDVDDLRGWVTCLVRPMTEHLAALGTPTWYARFTAQAQTSPALRSFMVEEALTQPALRRISAGLDRCRPAAPEEVRRERADMIRHLIVHTCAERERALAEGGPTRRASWEATATGLIDALVGLWQAPVTHRRSGGDT